MCMFSRLSPYVLLSLCLGLWVCIYLYVPMFVRPRPWFIFSGLHTFMWNSVKMMTGQLYRFEVQTDWERECMVVYPVYNCFDVGLSVSVFTHGPYSVGFRKGDGNSRVQEIVITKQRGFPSLFSPHHTMVHTHTYIGILLCKEVRRFSWTAFPLSCDRYVSGVQWRPTTPL